MKHKETTDSIVPDLVIAAVPFLVYTSVYRSLPSKIPVHYSFDGIADRFASNSLWKPCSFVLWAIVDVCLGFS